MATEKKVTPPPPPGFVMEDVPPPPPGFEMVGVPKAMRASFDRPKTEVERSRKAGEESLVDARRTMAGALPAAGAAAFVGASGGLGLIPTLGMAGLGGGFGEATKQLLDIPFGESPKTSAEATKKIVEQAGIQAGTELGGRAVAAGLRYGVNRLWKPLVEKAQEPANMAVIQAAQHLGIEDQLTIGEVTGSKPLLAIQSVAERSLAGRGEAAIRHKEVYESVVNAMNDSMSRLGPATSPEATGVKMQNAFDAMEQAIKKQEDVLHTAVDEAMKGAPVDRKAMRAIVQEHMAERAGAIKEAPSVSAPSSKMAAMAEDFGGGKELKGVDLSKFRPEVAQQIREKLLGTTEPLKWEDARRIYSDLTRAVRDETVPRDAQILGKRLIPVLRKSLNEAAQAQGQGAAFSEAQKYTRDMSELTKNTVIKALRDKDPALIASSVKTAEDARAVKTALLDVAKDTKAFENFQRQRLQSYLGDPDGSGQLALHKLSDNLKKAGEDRLGVEFSTGRGKVILQNARDVADIVDRVSSLKRAGGAEAMLSKFKEAADVNGIIQTAVASALEKSKWGTVKRLTKETAGLMAAPLVNRILANPVATKRLIEGIELLPKNQFNGMAQIERAGEIALRTLEAGVDVAQAKMEKSH